MEGRNKKIHAQYYEFLLGKKLMHVMKSIMYIFIEVQKEYFKG